MGYFLFGINLGLSCDKIILVILMDHFRFDDKRQKSAIVKVVVEIHFFCAVSRLMRNSQYVLTVDCNCIIQLVYEHMILLFCVCF